MITGVTVADDTVDLGRVLAANATIIHGRAAFDDNPTASAADLTLLLPDVDGLPAWTAGDPLTIAGDTGPLFTGTITDLRIPGHVNTAELGRCAQLEVQAAGLLATAGYRVVGDEPWPQETGSARAQRILDLAGLPGVVQVPVGAEVTVLPRDVDAQPALTLLDDLCGDTGAAVVDLPDGRILYQPLECRSRPLFNIRWMDVDPAGTWADVDPGTAWQDLDVLSPAAAAPVNLPPGAVSAEPQWTTSAASIVNQVRVSYGLPPEGGEQSTVGLDDQASISRYGLRYAYVGTQLAGVDDATARAQRVISTQAAQRWAIGNVQVWHTRLDDTTAKDVAALTCGGWVQLTGLPTPAPASGWAGIVEGWTYQETRIGAAPEVWYTLALSDPLHSLAVYTWADYPPTYLWADFPPAILWADLTSLDVLGV